MKSNSPLLQKPNMSLEVYQSITPQSAKWKYLSFEARQLKYGSGWKHNTKENEMVIVLLGGNYKITSNKGKWETKNGRINVFSGIAHTLYLPPNSDFELISTSETLDIAYGWCKASDEFPPKFVTPE